MRCHTHYLFIHCRALLHLPSPLMHRANPVFHNAKSVDGSDSVHQLFPLAQSQTYKHSTTLSWLQPRTPVRSLLLPALRVILLRPLLLRPQLPELNFTMGISSMRILIPPSDQPTTELEMNHVWDPKLRLPRLMKVKKAISMTAMMKVAKTNNLDGELLTGATVCIPVGDCLLMFMIALSQ